MRCYTQLALEQRYQIYALLKAGFDQTEIAGELGVHKSTISRETKRNRGLKGYRPRQAHCLTVARRKRCPSRRITNADWNVVAGLIKRDWSPEQIAGRLEREGGPRVSHEWIYRFIYADREMGGDLYRHLRGRKKYRKRYGSYDRRGQLPGRTSIDERPAVVEQKDRLGDWEGDTIIGGNHRGALVSLVERRSAFTLIGQVGLRTAGRVRDSVVELLKPYKSLVHTITCDNGREFAGHAAISEKLEAKVYFAHPYTSWERGLNENTNGLIRQYFPKRSDLSKVEGAELTKAMDRLNHRPRKNLGFKTPYEVFFKTSISLTVALGS